jgi:ligand-binding sensor domain-containing protein
MLRNIALFSFLSLALCLCAQYPGWTNYTNGFSVYGLAAEGTDLWAATGGGLVCIDTQSLDLEILDHANSSLPYNKLSDIAIDPDGVKWTYSSYYGLVRYYENSWQVFTPGFIYNTFNSIACTGTDDIWLGTDVGGLVHFDGSGFEQFTGFTNSSTPRADCVTLDQQGRVWFSSYDTISLSGELFYYDGTDFVLVQTPVAGQIGGAAYAIAFDALNRLWIGTYEQGVLCYDGSSWTNYIMSNSGILSDYIFSLGFDLSGQLWIGTALGLCSFDGSVWTPYTTQNSALLSNYVWDMSFDAQNVAWFATSKGVARFEGVHQQVINTSNSGMASTTTYDVVTTPDGTHWIADFSGLDKLEDGEWTVIDPPGNENTVYDLEADSEGNVWLAMRYGGLMKYNGEEWTQFNPTNSGLPSYLLQDLAIETQGRLWIGTQYDGVAAFSGTDWTIFNTLNTPLPSDNIYCVSTDAQNRVWIGCYGNPDIGGLASYDGTNWTVFTSTNSPLPSNMVHEIACRENTAWIATSAGLARYDGTLWTVYTTANSGLPSDEVTGLDFDSEGHLWLCTYGGGIAHFDGVDWTVYNWSNSGLIANYASYIKVDPDDQVWVGHHAAGISVYDHSDAAISDPEIGLATSVIVCPNPFSGSVTIHCETKGGLLKACLFNIRGQKLLEQDLDGKQEALINLGSNELSDLPSGIYVWKVTTYEGTGSIKTLRCK